MALWTSEDAAAATGGRATHPWQADGVSIDTRKPEVARAAVGGIALALSVPLTTGLAALLVEPGNRTPRHRVGEA